MFLVMIQDYFHIDILSKIMIGLITFIAIIISIFAKNYMKGDSLYHSFFMKIFILIPSLVLMTIANNVFIFLCTTILYNITITKLITHKPNWIAAQSSGRLALYNFILGFISLILAFLLLYQSTGSLSIQYILKHANNSWQTTIALFLLLITAMTQSAIWPFHRWLISSLNAPTPVSAIMHAGIINGGGFLLLRFAPLFLNQPKILSFIFILGFITAITGSVAKLIQTDIKRMLAFSTMGQMGFMFMQFGLGLFTSGLVHLCWHGIFKAYLFLSSASAAQDKRINFDFNLNITSFLLSIMTGIWGSYIFILCTNNGIVPLNGSLIIVGIILMTGSQLSLVLLDKKPFKNLPLAILLNVIIAAIYGLNVHFFEKILSPLNLFQPQPFNFLHSIAGAILAITWLLMLLKKQFNKSTTIPGYLLHLYVYCLNKSQPHFSTITHTRNKYFYR